MTAKKLGDKVKADFLQIALKFAAYQKDENSAEISTNSETLEALTSSMSTMTSAVTKMADTLASTASTCTNMGWRSKIVFYLEERI